MSKKDIIHGNRPLNIITLHGGPGALGELRKLSVKLSEYKGVIEYLQTGDSIKRVYYTNKKVDSYELLADHDEMVKFRYDLYKKNMN